MQLSKDFKIRCSAIGKIMTEPRTIKDKEAGKLSATCLTYVQEWIKEQPEFYNRRHEFSSKYTEKGIECENSSIEFAAKTYGWRNIEKNNHYKENEFLTGTPDIILENSVEDIKNSFSDKTFPLFEKEIPIDGYGWQLLGYCELFDKNQGGLIYTLMDAPASMIDKEAYYKAKSLGYDEVSVELYDEIKAHMTYSDLRDELRIKRFFIDADKSKMDLVFDKVEKIRNYIKCL